MASGKSVRKDASIAKGNGLRLLREETAQAKKTALKSASYRPKENPAAPRQTVMGGGGQEKEGFTVSVPTYLVQEKPGPVVFEPEFEPKPILTPITIKKPERQDASAFPSFGEIRAQESGADGLTDLFLPQPNLLQRTGDLAAGAIAGGLSALNQAGTFLTDQGVMREEERQRELEALSRQMEEAREERDFDLLKELELEKSGMGQSNLFFDLLRVGGWNTDPEKYEKINDLDPLAGEAERMDEELKRGLSPAEEQAAGVAQAAADLGANALLSGVSGVPLPVVQGVQQAGEAGAYALTQGEDPDTALAYALASGGAAYVTEKMGGIAGNWRQRLLQKAGGTAAGQALLRSIPQQVRDYIGTLSAGRLMQLVGAGAEEGLEEFNEYGLQLLLRNMMLDEETPYDVKEALANAGAGFLFGSAVRGADLLAGLDVSGAWDRAKTGLQNHLETGAAKPGSYAELDSAAKTRYDTGSSLNGESPLLAFLEINAERNGGNGIIGGDQAQGAGTGDAGGTAAGIGQTADAGGKRENLRRNLYQVSAQLRDMGRRDGTGGPAGRAGRGDAEADRTNSRRLNEYIRDKNVQKIRTGSGNMALYRPAEPPENSQAAKAYQTLTALGIPCAVTQGDIVIRSGGSTRLNHTGLTVRSRDHAKILLSDLLDIDGENTAYHEAYHYIGYTAPELREAFLDTLADNIDFNGDFQDFAVRIGGGYLTPEQLSAHPEQAAEKLLEEFGAYLCGETQVQDPNSEAWRMIKGFLKDPDAVYTAMVDMFTDFKARNPELDARPDLAGQDGFSELFHIRRPEADASVLQVEAQNFDSPLFLPLAERRGLAAGLTSGAAKPESYAADRYRERRAEALERIHERSRTRNAGPEAGAEAPPEQEQRFAPGEGEMREAEAFLNQSAEAAAPEQARTRAEQQAQRQFFREMRRALPLSGQKALEGVRGALSEAAAEYRASGTVSEGTRQRIFDDLYDSARVADDAYYNQYRGIKEDIRGTKLYLSARERANIQNFEEFRRANAGNFTVTKDASAGVPVDVRYQELSGAYPAFFPADITNPAAQLERMSEVSKGISRTVQSLDEYYGREAGEARKAAREAFDRALDGYLEKTGVPAQPRPEMTERERENLDEVLRMQDKGLLDDPAQADILRDAYQKVRKLQPAAYREGLLDSEKLYIDGIVRGAITLDDVPETEAKDLIGEVASARLALEEAMEPIREYNAARKQEELDRAREALIDSDLWKDKKMGILYSRETMERNTLDIAADKGKAEAVIDTYFTPVHEHEAQKQRFLNKYRDEVRALKLTKEESRWVQLLGENQQLWEDLPLHLDAEKIDRAITLLRDRIYPEIYNMLSDTLMLNGYAPPGYIQGYFPHFSDPDDPLSRMFRLFGMEVDLRELPAEIAGKTETFRPGRSFFANLLHREGTQTDYDALEGLDRYLEGAGNVIFHTQDIQRLRAFENVLREKYGRKAGGYRDDVNRQPMPTDYFEDQETDQVFGKDLRHLSRFVTELRSYTNSLAGKKSLADRNSEHKLGRGLYSLTKALENRVAANMVGVNPSSWLTNFVPLTQGAASISKRNLAQAIVDTGDNILKNDGFEQNSTFLTNRLGSKKAAQSGVERVSDALTKPMEIIDMATANILVRGRYLDNLQKGMKAEQAMREADKWAASLMADRSKGALPTIFNEKNFLTRLATMFQVEVNNQWSYFFKDLPRDSGSAKKLVSAAVQMALYSYLANEIYEWATGRRPAFDPIGWAEEFKEDYEEEGLSGAAAGLMENAAEQVPFTTALNFAGIEGGGRYPVASAIPDLAKVLDVTLGEGRDAAPNYRAETALREIAKPVYFVLPPVGGGQAKKTIEGIDALLSGGSYSTQKDGGEKLQYPVGGNLMEDLKVLTFGKSSLPQAQQYYDSWEPVQPDSIEGQIDAKARALPRLISYTYGEDENREQGEILLTGEQRRNFAESFRALLPDNMGELDEETQDTIYRYAEQIAQDEALAAAGAPEYEPESWALKMKEAADAGVPPDKYLEYRDRLSEIKESGGKSGADRKRETLLQDPELSAGQKLLLDQKLIGAETKADYTDENSFILSQMSESRQKKYSAAESAVPGMTALEFEWEMDALDAIEMDRNPDGTSVPGSRKEKQLEYLREQGYSMQEAYDLYNIQNLPSDWSGASEYGVSYDAFSDSMKKQYQAVQALFGEVSTAAFEYYRDLAEAENGVEERVRALTESGFSSRQAVSFLAALSISAGDSIDLSSPDAVLLSTLSPAQQQKYHAAADYFPGMPVSDYLYFRDGIAGIEGERDASGKTVSGTKKARQVARLMQMGMNYSQALVFYRIAG